MIANESNGHLQNSQLWQLGYCQFCKGTCHMLSHSALYACPATGLGTLTVPKHELACRLSCSVSTSTRQYRMNPLNQLHRMPIYRGVYKIIEIETLSLTVLWLHNLEIHGTTVAHIWSIALLTKRAVPLVNLSIVQHLASCTMFGQSHTALAIGLGLALRLGLGLGLELGLVLELGLG